jgi:hypothetical protein
MISRTKVVASYLHQKLAIEMKKHTLPKKEDAFSYKEIADEMWREAWDEAKKEFKTYFDWENNESSGQKKVLDFVDNSDPDISFHYKFNCDLWCAGGDWEEESYYFKCQMVDGTTYGDKADKNLPFPGPIGQYKKSHFILIPPKDGGNTKLLKGDKGIWVAPNNSDSGSKDLPDLDPKKAWEWLEDYLKSYIDSYFKNKASSNENR